MATQICAEEVESGNSGAPESAREVELPEQETVTGDELHCYVVFVEDCSVKDGIEKIRQQITGGEEISVEREDVTGNAVVVILSPEQYRQMQNLLEVKSIDVTKAAELTENANPENALERSEDTEAESDETEEMTTESLTLSDADSRQNFIETHVKELRIVTIVVLVIVIVVIYLQQKRR